MGGYPNTVIKNKENDMLKNIVIYQFYEPIFKTVVYSLPIHWASTKVSHWYSHRVRTTSVNTSSFSFRILNQYRSLADLVVLYAAISFLTLTINKWHGMLNTSDSRNHQLLTSTNSRAAIRSFKNLRTNARYFFSFGCLRRYSNIQYRRLLLQSFLTVLNLSFTTAAIPSSLPGEKGRGSPLRNAFT